MSIEAWWPQLRPETRAWLTANNGDAVPSVIAEEIAALGGPAIADAWWSDAEGASGRNMPDDAVDWIEEAANEEVSGT